ncbi:MAG: MarR family transcriptional regulator [Gemmatimonadaceae bacterium]|nr:MarR family transcriptional regulator [Gemmatimonadaceae bacterium]
MTKATETGRGRLRATKARRRGATTPRGAAPSASAADPATAASLKLWITLARAYQSVAELARIDIGRHGLSVGEFAVLEALHSKGEMLLGDVQRKVLVSSGGITFLMNRLVKRGLVERRACAADGRARYAALTSKGAALMRSIFPGHARAIRSAMSGLSVAEQKTVTKALRRLGFAAAALAAGHPTCREGIGGD